MKKLIFDNAGGLTIQLPGYAHYYQDVKQAVKDIIAYSEDGTTKGWEGNEKESKKLNPSYDEIRNGCYVIYTLSEFLSLSQDEIDGNGYNVQTLASCLGLTTCEDFAYNMQLDNSWRDSDGNNGITVTAKEILNSPLFRKIDKNIWVDEDGNYVTITDPENLKKLFEVVTE